MSIPIDLTAVTHRGLPAIFQTSAPPSKKDWRSQLAEANIGECSHYGVTTNGAAPMCPHCGRYAGTMSPAMKANLAKAKFSR